METSDLVALLRDNGAKIRKIEGQFFMRHGWINYSFPQLAEVPVNRRLVQMLKWRYPISVIKMGSKIKNGHEYILRTDSYSLEGFRKQTRTTFRKSLSTCEFKRPLLADLVSFGLQINRQTLKLQKRTDNILTDQRLWEKYISSFFDQPDTIIQGAYRDGVLIGYAICYKLGGKHYFHLQHIDRNYGTYYPMNGLMYCVINQVLANEGSIEVSDGIESFVPLPTLNKFKRYMRFERVPITRVYVLHPVLVTIFYPVVYVCVHILKKRSVKSQVIRNILNLYYGHRLLSRLVSRCV